jgi:hypothetical protein
LGVGFLVARQLSADIIIAICIALIGAGLFFTVEKYESNRLMADFLKFLVLGAGSAAILHKLQPLFGIGLF